MLPKQPKVLKGLPAAPGLTAGPVFIWQDLDLTLPAPYSSGDPGAAWGKISTAIDETRQEIEQIREKVMQTAGKEQSAIFDAHLMMVDDSALHNMVHELLDKGENPEAAWHTAVESFAARLEDLPDPTLSARAADVRDVGKRVLAHLLGKAGSQNALTEKSVVVARDLAPSQTAMLDHNLVLAFCTAEGGPTSHTAILAKALGIPAIVALGKSLLDLQAGDYVLVDTQLGALTINPTIEQRKVFAERQQQAEGRRVVDLKSALKPAITRDGVQVEVVANIGGAADAQTALERGAEGVGLFRTEFLYLNRKAMLSVDQQVEAYREVVRILDGRPLVVRTLDIGGDKQADYLGIIEEPNPFLGWRGIRMVSERPEILRDQIRALLKAARGSDLRIMLPMVSRLDEVIQARKVLNEALIQVRREVPGFQIKLQFGMMVEVPSAALMIEHFAQHVDFFSIGTNDLTQYTLAVDRLNARVASLASPFHPAVLKLIERTVRVGHQHKKWVGMCGEFAGEPLALPFLLGIGLDEFSMSPGLIPAAKSVIRKLSIEECKPVAEQTLKLASAEEVQSYLSSEYKRLAK